MLNFVRVAALQNKMLWKDQTTHLEMCTKDESLALRTLQEKVITPILFSLSRLETTYPLHIGACDFQVGCVVFQEQPFGPEKPIDYWSRSLNDTTRTMDVLIYCSFRITPKSIF